jgi:hypothetical protein
MAACRPISRDISIYVERYKAIGTMVSARFFRLRNGLFAMDTDEGLIYFLHYMGSNAKTTKEFIM